MKESVQLAYTYAKYICSTFFHNNYLKHHTKCSNCQYYICANCYIDSKSEAQVIEELIEEKESALKEKTEFSDLLKREKSRSDKLDR